MKYNKIILGLMLSIGLTGFAQEIEEEQEESSSSIQSYTPSKLLNQGQWDIKFFNNLYTQTRATGRDNSRASDGVRQTFFTTTLEVFTGVSRNNRINLGAIIEYRSNTIDDTTFSVFNFDDSSSARNGFSAIAPSIKIQPFENISNFSIQSSFHISFLEEGDDSTSEVFLDQSAWTFQNRFFYDYTFPSGDWQIFGELNTEYNFGDDESFANETFVLNPGAFLSYFPNDKVTLLAFSQYSQRFGDFEQRSLSLGVGGKLQVSDGINLEALYSNIVAGHNFQGLGNSFSLGVRILL